MPLKSNDKSAVFIEVRSCRSNAHNHESYDRVMM